MEVVAAIVTRRMNAAAGINGFASVKISENQWFNHAFQSFTGEDRDDDSRKSCRTYGHKKHESPSAMKHPSRL